MSRDELLASLTAERYDNRWWKTPIVTTPAEIAANDDLSAARRRRQMSEDFDRLNAADKEARI